MWPSKKKEKKGIKLAPGESMEIGFATSWRRDKDEVIIMTDSGPIVLDGKNELFIEVTANNIDPIRLQVVPDFKNKTINFVEVIDPNTKKKFPDRDSPRLTFAGSTIIKEKDMTISDYLKNWDKNMEEFEKLVKRSKLIRNIFVPANIILFFWYSYAISETRIFPSLDAMSFNISGRLSSISNSTSISFDMFISSDSSGTSISTYLFLTIIISPSLLQRIFLSNLYIVNNLYIISYVNLIYDISYIDIRLQLID